MHKIIGKLCLKLPLLKREYLSSAVNVLTNSLKIFHALRKTLSNSITFTVINEYGKRAVVDIETVFWPVYHVPCQWVP